MTPPVDRPPSARREEVLELAYRYVLGHGVSGMSLRPLAAAVGSSPRVLLFLFGSKDELVRALLARARQDELGLLDEVGSATGARALPAVAASVWAWLAAPERRPLLRLWAESYARSLVEPGGPWAGFARATVEDWLQLLAGAQPRRHRHTRAGEAERTFVLAVLRGALLDLLATDDERRTTAAVQCALRSLSLAQTGATVWLTGLPGSGKSTIGVALERALLARGQAAYLLDGDHIRRGLSDDLGFAPSDRAENVRRVGHVARLFADAGVVAVVSLVSPLRAYRAVARRLHAEAGLPFIEVHLNTSVEECARRDPKGHYARARAGELTEFTGVDAPYEAPERPELRLDTAEVEISAAVARILQALDELRAD